MILYLVGMSCVGKTTIGKMLAEQTGFSFFDLDLEIQNYLILGKQFTSNYE